MQVPVRRIIVGTAAALGVWVLLGGIQMGRTAAQLSQARESLTQAEEAVLANEVTRGAELLGDARDAFGAAHRHLTGKAVLPFRLVPTGARHISVLRDLSAAGQTATEAGQLVTVAIAQLPGGAEGLAPSGGRLPVDAYRALSGPIRHADALLARSVRDLERTRGIPVVGRVDAARRQALDLLPGAADAMHRGAIMLPALDQLLGGDRPRRYLFVAQNPAEIRGTGGFIGAYSLVTMDQGRFSFGDFDEIQALPAFPAGAVPPPSAEYARRYNRYGGAGFWHNINMTPDFPTAARAMETLYEQGTGRRVDGVIAVDPFALEGLLDVAGPVEVPGFGRVGSDDVIDVVSNRAHDELADSEARKRLLGAVAIGAFEGFLSGDGERAVDTAEQLIDLLRSGHLLLRSTDPEIQAALLTAGVAGAMLDPPGDYATVVANAGSAAKLDYYVRRSVDYDVALHADGSMTASLDTTFHNEAPTRGVSARVIGPNARGLSAGEQRLIVSLYAPDDARVESFSRTSGHRPVTIDHELGHAVFETVMEIPGGATQSLVVSWKRPDGWQRSREDGHYRLTMQGQPTIQETDVTVTVTLPPGMSVTGPGKGLQVLPDGRVQFAGPLESLLELDVRFTTTKPGLWERVRGWWSRPLGQ